MVPVNSTGAASVADLRGHLAAPSSGLKTLRNTIFRCPTGELGEFLGELAELRALAGAASVIVTADAEDRGVIESSQSGSTRGWVAEHGWHSRREGTTIAKAAHILRRPELAEITDSTRTADLDLATAVVVQAEYDKLAPELLPGAAPIVLKQMVSHGADHGPRGVRELRQYVLAQKRVLWQRDRHCTFPGCDIPAHWTDAHHLVHRIDGGPTDLDNAALLCRRHHTIVHRDELLGEIIAGQVIWDRRPGTYRPTRRPRSPEMITPIDPRLPRPRGAPAPLRT